MRSSSSSSSAAVGAAPRVLHDEPLEAGLAWSPDGEWLLARVADGLAIRDRVGLDVWQPGWR